MFSILLLAFRESFEAWLVFGIILTYLKTTERGHLLKPAYFGAIAGTIFSFVIGIALFLQAESLPENSKNIFQGIMMFVSSGLVAYFIVWMSQQNKNIVGRIRNKIESNTTSLGIFVLSFFSVVREGIELVTFIMAQIDGHPAQMVLIAILGMVLSGAVAYAIFYAASHYLIRYIFRALGVLLIYFGAEMFSEGLLKFFPLNGEMWEDILALVFAIPAIYIFFKDDADKWLMKIFNKK